MIVGESAEPAVRGAIEAHVAAQPEVKRVLRLITLQWGAHDRRRGAAPKWQPVATADGLDRRDQSRRGVRAAGVSAGRLGVLRAGEGASRTRHRVARALEAESSQS